MGMYDCVAGRLSAVAAALRRCLHDSSHGDVPMVKPCELDTTVWKVCSVGREIRADWLLIQSCFTESNVFAKTILWWFAAVNLDGHAERGFLEFTHPVSHPNLEHWPVLLRPFPRYFGMVLPQLNEAAEDWVAGNLGEALDLGDVGAVQQSDEEVDCRYHGNGRDLEGHGGQRAVRSSEFVWNRRKCGERFKRGDGEETARDATLVSELSAREEACLAGVRSLLQTTASQTSALPI